jgi:hypothetical protein
MGDDTSTASGENTAAQHTSGWRPKPKPRENKIEHDSILMYESGDAVYNRTSVTDTLVKSEINIVTSRIRALSKVAFTYPEKSRVKDALKIAFYMCPFAVAPPQFSRRSGGEASW